MNERRPASRARRIAPPARHMQAPPFHPYGWFPVARAGEVRAGTPTSVAFMGRSLVAFRDRTGAVRVVDAICPHFGAHLGDGEVVDGRLRCPYHRLEFDGDGRCVGAAAHYDARRVTHLRVDAYPSRERYGLVWLWHGPDLARPDRELPLDALDWDGWTEPVTGDGLRVDNLSPLWLAENIADLAHLRTVHCWDLDRVVSPPGERADGTFGVAVDVRWRLGARSADPRLRALGSYVHGPFHLDVRAVDSCVVVAHATLSAAQGGLEIRNVVTVTPREDGSTQLRLLVSVKRRWTGCAASLLRRTTGRGPEELLAPLFLLIGEHDFTSDARVWARRRHLEAPVPIAGEGAFIAFRKWSVRYWPEGGGGDKAASARAGRRRG